METLKASVVEENSKHFIEIVTDGKDIRIPISEDKPNEVKSAFNKLIEQIKKCEFEIKFEDEGDDLFYQVAKEYITQLNREIAEVRVEMSQYGLLEDGDGEQAEDDDIF